MKTLIQIGFRKSKGFGKEGQIIKAYVNGEECTWNKFSYDSENNGKWITPFSKSEYIGWYLWEGDLITGDIIRIDIKTSLVGKGTDEDRTMEMLFEVDEGRPVKEIVIPKIGAKGYPILKGRVIELAAVSEADKREQDIDDYLEEGF